MRQRIALVLVISFCGCGNEANETPDVFHDELVLSHIALIRNIANQTAREMDSLPKRPAGIIDTSEVPAERMTSYQMTYQWLSEELYLLRNSELVAPKEVQDLREQVEHIKNMLPKKHRIPLHRPM